MIDDEIADVLDNLQRFDDVLACMFVRSNANDILPRTVHFKPGVEKIWKVSTHAVEKIFRTIHAMDPLSVPKIEVELKDYYVLHFILPDKESMLISVIPRKTRGLGLIKIEMENTRRDILKLIGEPVIQPSKEVLA